MAIGRISGPMLFSNLERQGVDLAFESNLLYLDVNNSRVGVINDSPQYSFDSSGNVKLANIIITGDTFSANTGKIYFGSNANVGISGGELGYVLSTDGSGNLYWSNVSGLVSGTVTAGNLIANTISTVSANITGGNIINIYNFTTDNANIASGNITANLFGNVVGTFSSYSGNIYSNYTIGKVDSTTGTFTTSVTSANVIVANTYINATKVQLQDITVLGNTISTTSSDIIISANQSDPNNIIRFDSVSAIDIASGTTAQRPPNPDLGYLRYNTDIGSIEWYSGGVWVPGAAIITAQNITPDGINATYTLDSSTTAEGILVSINGTVQQASGYTVVGDQITFAEVPLTTDAIEIRYLTAGVATAPFTGGNVSGNLIPSANVTYDLGSTAYRWRDLWLSGNTLHLGSANITATSNTIVFATPGGTFTVNSNSSVTGANVSSNLNITSGTGIYTTISGAGGTVYAYQFDGSTQGVRLPTTTNLDFGSGDFTIEFWMKAGSSQSTYAMIADALNSNQYTGIGVGINDGSPAGYLKFRAQAGYAVIKTTTYVLDNNWRHIACVKSGSNGYLFVDGALEATTSAWSGVSAASLNDGQIGRSRFSSGTSSDNTYTGYLSNFRIIKGTALYTSTFTPPTATLTAVAGTEILTLQSATVVDNSTNGFSLVAKNVFPSATTSVVPSLTGGGSSDTVLPAFVYNSTSNIIVGNVALRIGSNVSARDYLFTNGVSILSTIAPSSTYSNTNVTALLSSNTISNIKTTGNIDVGGNLNITSNIIATSIITSGTSGNISGVNYIFANNVSYSNGVSILQEVQSNIGAYQTYANANASTQATSINTINANIGAYQTYANANASTQATSIDTINANLGAYQTYANANASTQATSIDTIDANIGAYQTYANANVVTIQANLGAYQTYANATFSVSTYSNTNVASYLTLGANIGSGSTTGNLVAKATTTSISTTTGALVVTGGAGIAGNIYTGGNIYISQGLTVGTTGFGAVGEIRATNNITAYYSSDRRLKSNVETISNALTKLRTLQGVMFDWNDDLIEAQGGEDGYFVRKHDTGIIAQDVEKVLPEVVAERNDGYLAVKYEKLAGLIIQAINELADQVDDIKKKLE